MPFRFGVGCFWPVFAGATAFPSNAKSCLEGVFLYPHWGKGFAGIPRT